MWAKQHASTHPSMSVFDFTHVGELRFDFLSPGPTIIPTGTDSLVISGPPPTAPKVVPLEMTTALDTVEPFLEITTASATVKTPLDITPAAASSEVFLGGTMEATTEAAPNNSSPAPNNTLLAQNINITSTLVSKSTYMPKSHQPLSTHAAAAETAAPTKEAEVAQTTGTAAATTECSGDLLNQEKPVGEERARHACMHGIKTASDRR